MSEDQIRLMLEQYGQALSTGDLRAVASWWGYPALVLSDAGATAVVEPGEVERFFAQAAAYYRAQGLVATRPELERVERLSEQITAVDVRWPTFDAAGAEAASERSHYLLGLGEDGQPRIRVALTRTM